jgi:hypothetical protein
MRQQLYLDSRFGQNLGAGTLFWLHDSIVLPSSRYAFTLGVSFIAVPLTNYGINAVNQKLDISYPAQLEPSIIEFPLGNHSIDFSGSKRLTRKTQTRCTSPHKLSVRSCRSGPLQPAAASSGSTPETRASSDHTLRRTESTLIIPHSSTSDPTFGR